MKKNENLTLWYILELLCTHLHMTNSPLAYELEYFLTSENIFLPFLISLFKIKRYGWVLIKAYESPTWLDNTFRTKRIKNRPNQIVKIQPKLEFLSMYKRILFDLSNVPCLNSEYFFPKDLLRPHILKHKELERFYDLCTFQEGLELYVRCGGKNVKEFIMTRGNIDLSSFDQYVRTYIQNARNNYELL